jgi:hypothetical protein
MILKQQPLPKLQEQSLQHPISKPCAILKFPALFITTSLEQLR